MSAPDAPMRDPGYAPRALETEWRADGALVLTNPRPVTGAFETTVGPLEHWAARTPRRTWLAERSGEGWRETSYAEAWDQVRAIAGGLAGLGLEPGAPVLLLARNGIDTALFAYAVMSQAHPSSPVSPQYGLAGADLSRLAHAVRLLDPAAVYVDDAEAFAAALDAPFLAGLPVIAGRGPGRGHITLADLRRARPAALIAAAGDLARLLLTSGSTGDPKAVMAHHSHVAQNAAQIAGCYRDDDPPPVMVNHAPWSHSMGVGSMLHYSLHRGGTLYIDGGQPAPGRFGETLRNLRDVAPTYHNMVPAGWDLLVDELERDEALARHFFSRLRVMQYGGAALGQSTAARIQAAAVRTVGEAITFASGWGSTETGPLATNVHWPNRTMGLVGLPVPGTSVKLAPRDGKLELLVKGPQVTPGYYRAPDVTRAAFDEEGFYRTGDAGRLVDPARLEAGLAFDGRLAENFKLASGTFVNAGALRVAALSAMAGAARDAVVCGEGRRAVGLMIFRNAAFAGGDEAAQREAVRAGLAALNGAARGAGERVGRALILADQPDPASGEITDKGYLNQSRARARRSGEIERLFADRPDPDILILEA
jgi:feruloyl-CoA synthase